MNFPQLEKNAYLVPRVVRTRFQNNLVVTLPFWIPAFLCLAWPVTSFILARRRHKRGFPVVQAEVRDQKSELSQKSGAPKGQLEREPGASPRDSGGA